MGNQIVPPFKRNLGPKEKHKSYGHHKTRLIQILYILASVLWLTLALYLDLFHTNWIGWLLIFLPILIFAVSFHYANHLTTDLEEQMFCYDYFTIGILIALPLLTWMSKDYGGDRQQFIRMIMIAIVLALLSVLDVWLPRKWIAIMKHIKAILQTMAIVLIILALYIYYIRKTSNTFSSMYD